MKLGRPTPSFAVALLALTVALSGTSYAAIKIGTKDLKNNAVTSAKIKDRTIKQKDISPGAVTALKGSSFRAYGAVTPGVPALVPERTLGFSSVTRPSTGVYCLVLSNNSLDASTSAPQVSVEWGASTGSSLSAYVQYSLAECPEGTDVKVRTYTWSSTTESTPSNQVAFTVLVP